MSIPERPAQLLLLQDSLIKLKDYEVCFRIVLWHCCLEPSKMYTGWYYIFLSYLGALYESTGLVKVGFTWCILIAQYLSSFVRDLPKTLLVARNTQLYRRTLLCSLIEALVIYVHRCALVQMFLLKSSNWFFCYLVIPAMSHVLRGCSQWSCVTDESMRCLVYRSVQALWVHR